MQRHGYITKQEAELAKSIKVEDQLVDSSANKGSTDGGTQYQSYVDAVIAETKELTGMDPTVVPMKIWILRFRLRSTIFRPAKPMFSSRMS